VDKLKELLWERCKIARYTDSAAPGFAPMYTLPATFYTTVATVLVDQERNFPTVYAVIMGAPSKSFFG
jgi:hypothetical protein